MQNLGESLSNVGVSVQGTALAFRGLVLSIVLSNLLGPHSTLISGVPMEIKKKFFLDIFIQKAIYFASSKSILTTP